MRHLPILLCCCILWIIQPSLFAQKKFTAWDQVEWEVFTKNFSSAQSQLEEVRKEDKKNQGLADYWQGIILLKSGKLEAGKTFFEEIIREKERSPLARVGLAHYYALRKDFSFSQAQVSKAIKYGKSKDLELELAIMRVNLVGKQDENASARAILSNISEKRLHDISPRLILFNYYKQLEVVEPAEKIGLELVELTPSKARIYVDLAELYLNSWNSKFRHLERDGALKTSYRYIQQAFADKPNYADAFHLRARLYILSNFPGKFQKARDDMATYLKLRKNDQVAQVRYAKFLFLAEDYKEALGLIEELQTKAVKDKVLQRLKGIALSKLGRLTEARKAMDVYFKQVAAEYRISPDYETYGNILRELESPAAAQSYYELAIEKKAERISLYGEIADEYYEQAKKLKNQWETVRKEGRKIQKELSQLIAEHNKLAEEEASEQLLDQAQALKDEIELHKDQLEIFYQDSQELDEKVLIVYEKEAFYREKALKLEDNLSLRNQRKYADALFNSRKYELAERAYSHIHEMKEDYLYPYERRLQIALRLAKADGKEGPGMKRAVPVSQDIIRIFLPKVDELKEKQQKSVLIALESMAVYSFDPQRDENYDCQAAKPYLEQLKNLDSAYLEAKDGLKQMDMYCEE